MEPRLKAALEAAFAFISSWEVSFGEAILIPE